MTTTAAPAKGAGSTVIQSLWNRQLSRYPATGPRAWYLGLGVVATIVLYYELYIQGAVSTQIITTYNMSLRYFILISIIGNAVGAFASLAAGLADRWGRANLVVYGLLITGLLILFGLPHAPDKVSYLILFAVVSLVEGVILVATPALIRDFSPQLGRASAMGFWTLGPVIGSLVVTEVSSHTLASHPDWRFQFYVCGIVGLIVFALAFVGLRELSPRLRDQLMVSLRDRALVEARAAGIDPRTALQGSWRQMLRLDVIGPAFAISIFLLFYYILVGFFVVYYATTFGYSPARANSLANWYWIANAIALVVVGAVSDRIKVRKPFMIVGTAISAAGVAIFATRATEPGTGYYYFAWLLAATAVGGGMAYCAWMASFTETVESHNPAATATGLAVWGWTIRMVVTLTLIAFTFVVTAASTLVDQGPQVQALAAKYHPQLTTIAKVDPATRQTLTADPADQAAQVKAVSEIAGVSPADVVQVKTLSAQYAAQLATVQAIDTSTLTTLSTNPADPAAQAKAVGEITAKFGVPPAVAIQRLLAVAAVPKSALLFLLTTGPQVQRAATELTAAAQVPKADLAYLQRYGTKVAQAAKDSPHQWQLWWWICYAGQLAFVPFIWLLRGRWSPRRAGADTAAHDEAVARELEALGRSAGSPSAGRT